MDIGTSHYLVLSAILFAIGMVGIATRRNMIIVLMSVELVLNSGGDTGTYGNDTVTLA